MLFPKRCSKCILLLSIGVCICWTLPNILNLCSGGNNAIVPSKEVTILLWTTRYLLNYSSKFNYMTQKFCPQYACRAIEDKSREVEADAILFHFVSRDMLNAKDLPRKRQSRQYYVFYLIESPSHPSVRMNFQRFAGFFNLTMSYRVGSDIEHRYLEFHNRSSSSQRAIEANLEQPRKSRNEIRAIVATKTKLVAWFVSNCLATSQRQLVVRELQKHIPIDVYGQCGPLKCPHGPACERLLNRDYKFYVAFENSACLDYVTEKFRRLRYFVVPLILRESDYRNVVPKGTYIAVDQFPSIRHFAEYLIYLDNNPEAYIKYFEWQETMTVVPSVGFCELCRKLTIGKFPKSKVYEDLHYWWHGKGECAFGIGSELATRSEFSNHSVPNMRSGKLPYYVEQPVPSKVHK